MENLVAHRLHCCVMGVKKILVAPRQHGDLALIGQMHAAGDRKLHHPHPRLCRNGGQGQDLIPAKGRHFQPMRAGFHLGQDIAQDAL